jgi:N-acetylglucosaminyl-diphospho-decaprenol L-rhamnosyltransferase
MDVSIIIVNWNSKQFLRDCIGSVERNTTGIDFEIIVVDSGSFDGCGDMLRADFPYVRFIQSEGNVGFAGANNLAYRNCSGQYVLFLNPDTELTSAAVNMMLEHLQWHPDAGAVGCKLLNRDGSIQTSCIQSFPTILNQSLNSALLRRLFPTATLWGMSPLFRSSAEPAKVDVVSGACVMLPRSVFEKIGQFSEEYFMFAEDLDLCHKLMQAGYANYYLSWVTVRHFGGGSTDSAPSEFSVVMMRESIWRFLRKSRGALYAFTYRLSTLLSAVVRLGMLSILLPFKNRTQWPQSSTRKWRAILAWSLWIRRPTFPP